MIPDYFQSHPAMYVLVIFALLIWLLPRHRRRRRRHYLKYGYHKSYRRRHRYPRPVQRERTRHIDQDVKVAVSVRDGGRCRHCGSNDNLQFDHITPYSKGGTNDVRNIQLLCGHCNESKGNRYTG